LKLARLLTDYLIEQKELTLPGIGHFSLIPSQQAMPDDKKEAPIGEIHFKPDPKATLGDNLVKYVSAKSGKMRPLAVSDIESYLENGVQLLNISKPFLIEGMGTLLSKSDRSLEFVQGEAVIQGDDSIPPRRQKTTDEKDVNFEENYFRPNRKPSSGGRRLAVAGLVILGLCLIGWVAWFFYQRSLDETQGQVLEPSPSGTDMPAQTASYQVSPPVPSQVTDSANLKTNLDTASQLSAQSTATETVPVQTAPTGFDLVLEIAPKNRAFKRYADLKEWGHKVQMSTGDSLTFKLSIPVDAPLSDSIRHRDSLSRFFGRKVWIETH
jgi:hypothetical protein